MLRLLAIAVLTLIAIYIAVIITIFLLPYVIGFILIVLAIGMMKKGWDQLQRNQPEEPRKLNINEEPPL